MMAKDPVSRRYVCRLCNKSFKLPHHVQAHLEVAHIQVAAYHCQFCEQSFYTNNYLLNHIRQRHAEEKQKQFMYQCLQ